MCNSVSRSEGCSPVFGRWSTRAVGMDGVPSMEAIERREDALARRAAELAGQLDEETTLAHAYEALATRTVRTVTSPFDKVVALIEEQASAGD